jgi:hypothetical protein
MTMNKLIKRLTQNALLAAEEGDLVRAETCIELLAHIKTRGYDTLVRKIDLAG